MVGRELLGVASPQDRIQLLDQLHEAVGVAARVVQRQRDHRRAADHRLDEAAQQRPVLEIERCAVEEAHRGVELVVGQRGAGHLHVDGGVRVQPAARRREVPRQRHVACGGESQCVGERVAVERSVHAVEVADVVAVTAAPGGAVELLVEQERPLAGRQAWDGVRVGARWLADAVTAAGRIELDRRGERPRGGVNEREFLAHRAAQPLAQHDDHLQRRERVAAEREEVVVEADGLHLQHRLPHRHHHRLQRRLG
ncbi:unannotated protein [freshwater metagenome]|uniref:Unannotated protein n=1 Tax=freshwater metagenome TaxID=449393 RepID=A0A6J6GM41_9ZZZZ